ncbi:MAG: cytochrome c oxidase subunit II [Anaerolineae bacterium]|nr:cytochrome c oxidase subunit II [Caldilineales bacterium]MCX7851718.1 cytochrome c oxidase subunit II [Caldilineales bacterium]MDW8268140.1 cytochrome c oxidase subunit II [Anaerolineae bacterium]
MSPQVNAPHLEVDVYEKRWLLLSVVLLVLFTLAIGLSSFAYGIQVPSPEQRVNPNTVAQEGPWAQPGLRELAPGKYEAYVLAQIWTFLPNTITVKAGSTVTFYITSKDVQHGFQLEGTNVNLMVLPGQVSKLTATFKQPGEYRFVCHEYCGVGHHTMFGKVVVEP